jgi:hypothetical protein
MKYSQTELRDRELWAYKVEGHKELQGIGNGIIILQRETIYGLRC